MMKVDHQPELITQISYDPDYLTGQEELLRCQRISIMSHRSYAVIAASFIQYHTLNYCQQANRRLDLAKMIKVDVLKLTIACSGQAYSFSLLSQDCNLLILPALGKWYERGDHSPLHKQIISVDCSSGDLAFQWILVSLAVCREALSV